MRPSMYAGVSTALAGGMVAYAFAQRPNFYSACVFLSHSNLALMILINLCFIIAFSVVWTLSRLLYGRLRPVEVEQLYERGWFAVTETCLAMTIFRDEIGAWFITMFVALMAGKVWGWIGHGRVEILEQQPPANPRTFHTRLVLSLLLSLAYDFAFVSYAANTVYEQARPNMMVMFLFEYVLLTISSVSTALRYVIAVIDIRVHQKQAQEMLAIRRAEVRERREEILRQREARAESGEAAPGREEPLPSEDDIEEMDIEPPGWEGKGQMVLILDLVSDLFRLLVYLGFFAILSTFFGLPIHIMRDLFMTARSFIKRLNAMLRYRNATRDMNAKYPDATAAEISDNDTCIICREEMRPWNFPNQDGGRRVDGTQPAARPALQVSERHRPKKLPCGHVLHLGCLKSWLERQQFCPTCRAPVNGPTPVAGTAGQAAPAAGQPLGRGAQANAAGAPPQQGNPRAPAAVANNGIRGGMINLGPLRLAYGRAVVPTDPTAAIHAAHQAAQAAHLAMMERARIQPGAHLGLPHIGGWRAPQVPSPGPPASANATADIGEMIENIEQRIMEDATRLEVQREELAVLKSMHQELARLRTLERERRSGQQLDAAPTDARATISAGATTANMSSVEPTRTTSAVTENGGAIGTSSIGNSQRTITSSDPDAAIKRTAAEQPLLPTDTGEDDTAAPPNQEAGAESEEITADPPNAAPAPANETRTRGAQGDDRSAE